MPHLGSFSLTVLPSGRCQRLSSTSHVSSSRTGQRVGPVWSGDDSGTGNCSLRHLAGDGRQTRLARDPCHRRDCLKSRFRCARSGSPCDRWRAAHPALRNRRQSARCPRFSSQAFPRRAQCLPVERYSRRVVSRILGLSAERSPWVFPIRDRRRKPSNILA